MVVYLIVKGDYDERVCAVTGNKEKAERLKKLFSSDFPTAEIKKYDTKDSDEIAIAGYKPFRITSTTDGVSIRIEEDIDWDYNEFKKTSWNTFDIETCHSAVKERKKKKKIFRALLAEYRYENES